MFTRSKVCGSMNDVEDVRCMYSQRIQTADIQVGEKHKWRITSRGQDCKHVGKCDDGLFDMDVIVNSHKRAGFTLRPTNF